MTSTITLITGDGSVRVYGDNLVLDLRNSNQGEGNGLALPVETATERQAACIDRPDHSNSSEPPRSDNAGEATPSQAHASPAPLLILKLRPYCQQPKCCRSGTRDHCHTCKKAMAESEAA